MFHFQKLRDKFIFKIVPMLNPDGVIVGNTRCSLAGRDLNRQYRVVSRECFPPVWHVKMLIRKYALFTINFSYQKKIKPLIIGLICCWQTRLIEERPVLLYCDFHSHSRKHNIFIYGCEDKDVNDFPLLEQVFPLMLHSASRGKVRIREKLCPGISYDVNNNSTLIFTVWFRKLQICGAASQRRDWKSCNETTGGAA